MEIVKIGVLGMLGVMLAVHFKSVKAEYSIYIATATGIIIFYYAASCFSVFLEQLQELQSFAGEENGFIKILLKVIGITYICEFCSGICRDAGYASVGGQIEIFGKVLVLMNGLPILLSVVKTIHAFER